MKNCSKTGFEPEFDKFPKCRGFLIRLLQRAASARRFDLTFLQHRPLVAGRNTVRCRWMMQQCALQTDRVAMDDGYEPVF